MIVKILLIAALVFYMLLFVLFLYVFYNGFSFSRRKKPEDYLHDGYFRPYTAEFRNNLSELNKMDYRQLYIKSRDGHKLAAKYYEFFTNAPLAILMHGYKASAEGDFCALIPILKKNGFNVLLVDQRACGISEAGVVTFGIKESKDCLDWIRFSEKKFGKNIKIVLFGLSMGAASVLTVSSVVPESVKGIFSDSSYTSASEIIKVFLYKKNLPIDFLYALVKYSARVFGRFDLEENSPMESVADARVPVYLIHGYPDGLVPYSMASKLYQCCSSEKKLITFKLADHAVGVYSDKALYEETVREFVQKLDLKE